MLWIAGDAATAAVVALFVVRRAFRSLPIFFSYLVWSLLSDVVQVAVTHRYPASVFNIYLAGLIVDSVFQYGVLVELAWSVLRPIRASLPGWSLAVVALLFALVGAAVWPLVSGPGLSAFPLAARLIVHVQETFSILRILFFLLLAACSQLLAIGWRDRELQVATGLGFYSMVSLAVWLHHTGQAPGPQYHLLDQMVAASYICSLLYWAFSFAQKEAGRREFTPQMQNFLLAVAGAARNTRMTLTDSTSVKDRDRGN